MKKNEEEKMGNNYGRSLKNQRAITLIALVVTIVVLLILARSKYININRREPAFLIKLQMAKNKLKLQVKKNKYS